MEERGACGCFAPARPHPSGVLLAACYESTRACVQVLYPKAGFAGPVTEDEAKKAEEEFNADIMPAFSHILGRTEGPLLGGKLITCLDQDVRCCSYQSAESRNCRYDTCMSACGRLVLVCERKFLHVCARTLNAGTKPNIADLAFMGYIMPTMLKCPDSFVAKNAVLSVRTGCILLYTRTGMEMEGTGSRAGVFCVGCQIVCQHARTQSGPVHEAMC